MKHAFIVPGLLATAMAAALPAGDLVPEFSDAPFDLAQVTVEAPFDHAAAVDPEYFLNSGGDGDDDDFNLLTSGGDDDDDFNLLTSGGGDDDDDFNLLTSGGGDDDDDFNLLVSRGGGDDDDDFNLLKSGGGDDDDDFNLLTSGGGDDDDDFNLLHLNVDGEAAWLKIQSEIVAELNKVNQDGHAALEAPTHVMKWSGLHMTTSTATSDINTADSDSILPLPGTQWPIQKPSWWPGSGQPIPDFHYGLTADGVCEYLRGAHWKVNELRRPAEQFSPEYVPWLVWNKGPYYYVLEGLREIEWVLLRIAYLLETTSSFTPEEQLKIIRCHIQFAGYTPKSDRVITPLPRPINPRDWPPVSMVPRALSTESVTPADPTPTTTAGGPEPTRRVVVVRPRPGNPVPGRPRPGTPVIVRPRPNPWANRFTLRSLLKVIGEKRMYLQYQTYALSRFERVLRNLDTAVKLYHDQLLRAITLKKANDLILFEKNGRNGLADFVEMVLEAHSGPDRK